MANKPDLSEVRPENTSTAGFFERNAGRCLAAAAVGMCLLEAVPAVLGGPRDSPVALTTMLTGMAVTAVSLFGGIAGLGARAERSVSSEQASKPQPVKMNAPAV